MSCANGTERVHAALSVATVTAYLGNRYWAFKHRKTANMRRETVLFIFFNIIGTLIFQPCLPFNAEAGFERNCAIQLSYPT